jgi:hypothetical protein
LSFLDVDFSTAIKLKTKTTIKRVTSWGKFESESILIIMSCVLMDIEKRKDGLHVTHILGPSLDSNCIPASCGILSANLRWMLANHCAIHSIQFYRTFTGRPAVGGTSIVLIFRIMLPVNSVPILSPITCIPVIIN